MVEQHLPKAHGYADDHHIYFVFKPSDQTTQEEALQAIQNCVNDIRKWGCWQISLKLMMEKQSFS